ncbi:hypothetical protein A3D00_00925 [Candidatus Woesebacteria bacterium RIFCSPHIGHO2_02_FULL_38_9]|uniref:Glycosyltransferase 2-like domain-containing protein n=1 Tax=Candidatus Woesebacteria bacterium RIFCSPHIGHO2_01_FULL_39_28 TaxID=1802496 RepID=A0A1F7YHD6_9BACT|nr:MAG: hypothetical protein A2627_02255 [Candidatus Woesebacteria bacterium RIFCSPHIGHO2_01_FULL_39_28]OGM31420.1 MAG: hypothetical protein A3D00_00925 [Candidatus Woesebacteria bacterium RIFCSPHIGHO2_02_FULL_38_9]OGM58158.1 MAG: hypothetical protein A3A50_00135 [Candidatus Woesebacteria bacterium RIFCSPLOWO2_01_FULL_38_20]
MGKIINELSVFFPAYNEEASVKSTVNKAVVILEQIADKWEIIIVDDGSKDKTGIIANSLSKKFKNVKVITHSPNRGYGAALKSGFYNARYSWIAFSDIDGQFDFSEISKFIEKQRKTNADLIIGYYRDRKVSFQRKVNTFVWQMFVFLLFGLHVKDIDCGFKLISKKAINKIPKLESERGAFISSELLIKAEKYGFKIVEIGVTHNPRKFGKGTGADLNVIVKSFVDLFRLWRKLH